MSDRLEQALAHARGTNSRVAVMFLDLDRFKLVNDSLGHQAGDALLVEVGDPAASAMREGDTVARLGGDEFVVLLADLERRRRRARGRAQDRSSALAPPFPLDGREIDVTASIGIAIFPQDGERRETLLQ